MYKRLTSVFCLLLLGGCASNVPMTIQNKPVPNISYSQVKDNISSNVGQTVRWGGKIISVENREQSTWVEILATRLKSFGRPGSQDKYQGRFIARIDGFLDPEYYAKDKQLTVYGQIEDELTKKIDEHAYQYPVIAVNEYYLWPDYRRYRHPYYYPYFYPYRHQPYYPYYRSFHGPYLYW